MGEAHRLRTAKLGMSCSCYHCTGDLTSRGGWIAAANAAGVDPWIEANRYRDELLERQRDVWPVTGYPPRCQGCGERFESLLLRRRPRRRHARAK